MGMSMHVVGFHERDDRWDKMLAIWDSCRDADIDVPREVSDFFDGEYPGDAPGRSIDLEDYKCCSEYREDASEGFEIDLDLIPEGVTVLRFYCSY